jgi:hypothetical protein
MLCTLCINFNTRYSHRFIMAGNLSIIPALHRLIEPTRLSSLDSLHLTSIRNECAYYRCVINVLAHRGVAIDIHGPKFEPPVISNDLKGISRPLESVANHRGANSLCDDFWSEKLSITPREVREASKRPIYIVGDSHCMSLAWSIISVDERHQEKGRTEVGAALGAGTGHSRLLVPQLVTGLKQWHLRNEGTFYPKANFHHTIEGIPSGSDVSHHPLLSDIAPSAFNYSSLLFFNEIPLSTFGRSSLILVR